LEPADPDRLIATLAVVLHHRWQRQYRLHSPVSAPALTPYTGWQCLCRLERAAEQTFDRLNPAFGVPADQRSHYGHQAVRDREAALALGVRVAIHDSRQNDPNPVVWQAGQDYRIADALQAARTHPTRTRHGPERLGPER
jgi:hypothetical protein